MAYTNSDKTIFFPVDNQPNKILNLTQADDNDFDWRLVHYMDFTESLTGAWAGIVTGMVSGAAAGMVVGGICAGPGAILGAGAVVGMTTGLLIGAACAFFSECDRLGYFDFNTEKELVAEGSHPHDIL